MELGGWKTLTMVSRYAHVNSEHLAASVLRLGVPPGQNSGDSDLTVSDPQANTKA